MTREQVLATQSLKRALNKCHSVGLRGGVFDNSFCLWPSSLQPDPRESGGRFFQVVLENGAIISSPINIDGGAGL